jgi:hydrogenase/urease accessory protein HupE
VGIMPVLIKLLFSLLLLAVHAQSVAHEGRPVYIQVNEQGQGIVDVRWKTPPVMAKGQEPFITLRGNDCQRIDPSANRLLNTLSGHNQFQCHINNNNSNNTMRIMLIYPDNNPVLSSLISFQNRNGFSYSLFNGPDTLSIQLPEKMTFISVAKQYVQGGFFHILSGFDHLLFVLCLMQIARSKRNLVLTITGFTLGHSITLGLASLGLVNVHLNVVELLIALSIVLLIVEITKVALGRPSKSLIWHYPAIVSLGFGLLHGFGFASALGELGLPASMKISALAFFNLGVELGQLAFIASVLGLISFMSYLYARVFNHVLAPDKLNTAKGRIHFPMIILYAIGSLSCYWFIDRSLNLFI